MQTVPFFFPERLSENGGKQIKPTGSLFDCNKKNEYLHISLPRKLSLSSATVQNVFARYPLFTSSVTVGSAHLSTTHFSLKKFRSRIYPIKILWHVVSTIFNKLLNPHHPHLSGHIINYPIKYSVNLIDNFQFNLEIHVPPSL